MFCKFCGKEIPEGSICNCRANASETNSSIQTQQIEVKNDWKNLLVSCKDVMLNYFKKPLDTTKQIYSNRGDETFVLGGVFLILVFVAIKVMLGSFSSYIDSTKTGIYAVLIICAEKAMFSGLLYAFSKKNGSNFKHILKATCLTTVQLSACVLFIILFSLMGFATGIALMLLCYVMSDILAGMIVVDTVFENKNIGYWVHMTITLVIVTVGYIILRNVVVTAVEDLMSSFSAYDLLF